MQISTQPSSEGVISTGSIPKVTLPKGFVSKRSISTCLNGTVITGVVKCSRSFFDVEITSPVAHISTRRAFSKPLPDQFEGDAFAAECNKLLVELYQIAAHSC